MIFASVVCIVNIQKVLYLKLCCHFLSLQHIRNDLRGF